MFRNGRSFSDDRHLSARTGGDSHALCRRRTVVGSAVKKDSSPAGPAIRNRPRSGFVQPSGAMAGGDAFEHLARREIDQTSDEKTKIEPPPPTPARSSPLSSSRSPPRRRRAPRARSSGPPVSSASQSPVIFAVGARLDDYVLSSQENRAARGELLLRRVARRVFRAPAHRETSPPRPNTCNAHRPRPAAACTAGFDGLGWHGM